MTDGYWDKNRPGDIAKEVGRNSAIVSLSYTTRVPKALASAKYIDSTLSVDILLSS